MKRPKYRIGDKVYVPVRDGVNILMKVGYVYRHEDSFLYKFKEKRTDKVHLIKEEAL